MTKSFRETRLGDHPLHAETLMLGYGFDPALSEGAVKPPVFLTSTFCFPSADAGREFFDIAAGRIAGKADVDGGLVYSRLNHPNAQIVEERLALLEGADTGAVFSSGMMATATVLLAHCRPGDVVLHSTPLYGGTDGLLHKLLPEFGIRAFAIADPNDAPTFAAQVREAESYGRLAVIFLETPSNPLATLADIGLAATLADESAGRQTHRPLVVVDNTLMGPVFQNALRAGADLSVYSLTKSVGGHSDLIAGAVLGRRAAMTHVRALRGMIGGHLDPHSCWMLSRSLETVSLRMRRAADNATVIADWLARRNDLQGVFFPTLLPPGSRERAIYERQCTGPGALLAFDAGTRARAFRMLDRLRIFKLAVSLGGTESLACHPATTVTSGVEPAVREAMGVTDGLVRLAVGIEHVDDLIADLECALAEA